MIFFFFTNDGRWNQWGNWTITIDTMTIQDFSSDQFNWHFVVVCLSASDTDFWIVLLQSNSYNPFLTIEQYYATDPFEPHIAAFTRSAIWTPSYNRPDWRGTTKQVTRSPFTGVLLLLITSKSLTMTTQLKRTLLQDLQPSDRAQSLTVSKTRRHLTTKMEKSVNLSRPRVDASPEDLQFSASAKRPRTLFRGEFLTQPAKPCLQHPKAEDKPTKTGRLL